VFLAINKIAVASSASGRVIRFHGTIQGHSVMILLDSGSSASFISPDVAARLSGISVVPMTSSVRIARGGLLNSSAMLLQL
jgi:hypothetical protein